MGKHKKNDACNVSKNYHKVVDVHSDVQSATNILLSHNPNFPNLCRKSKNHQVYAVFVNLKLHFLTFIKLQVLSVREYGLYLL